ncbi:hypothetical protein [Bacteroides acidifaciens]|nr:hypothetical protein [Bacteroides acidifaciens]
MSRTRRTTPGSVCLNFAAGCASIANKSVCGYLPEPYTDTIAHIQA